MVRFLNIAVICLMFPRAFAGEANLPTLEQVDQIVVWALSPDMMKEVDDMEAKSSKEIVCESPGMMGRTWTTETFLGYADNQDMAYYTSGLRCLRRFCNGVVQQHVANRITSSGVNDIIMQGQNLYLSDGKMQALQDALSDPSKTQVLTDRVKSASCLDPNQLELRNFAHMACFIGMYCGTPEQLGLPGSSSTQRKQKSSSDANSGASSTKGSKK